MKKCQILAVMLILLTLSKKYSDKQVYSKQSSFERINNLIYSSAVTLKLHMNDVTIKSSNNRKSSEPKSLVQQTDKIRRFRHDITHIDLIQKCKQTNSYTVNQKRIPIKLIWKYHNIRQHTLTYHISFLKEGLKATSSYLNYQKKVSDHKQIS